VKATVLVRPKAGILDPQGEAVLNGLGHLGFGGVRKAHVGRLVELELDATDAAAARKEIAAMCDQLIANPLIESYEITIEGEGA
jgi:phosphoribosylformylglycinamidine synthase PurS subunit